MTKEEFIKECAMRNLAAATSLSGTLQCNTKECISRCVSMAKKLADLLYDAEIAQEARA